MPSRETSAAAAVHIATQDPVAQAIAAIVFGQRVTIPNVRAAVLPQSILLSYEGHYQFGPDFFDPDAKFRLIAQPRYLLLQLANDSRPLVPLSPTEFLERKFFGHIVAEQDEQGKVIGLLVRYGAQDFHAIRLGRGTCHLAIRMAGGRMGLSSIGMINPHAYRRMAAS